MPTYDYKCHECGHVFEEFQSMKAEPLKECPQCGRPALKRLMAGGAGMIFKGSGFYATDYRRSDGKGTSSSAEKGSGETDSKKKGTDKPSKADSSDTKKD